MFPSGYFYILSRKNGYALDVYDGQTKSGANVIIWPQKFADADNQLWSYDGGRIVNKKSGHVLDIQSGAFKKDKTIIQSKRKEKNQSQEWGYENGFIYSVVYPTMILEIKSEDGGAQVLLERKDTNNLNQQWHVEPYQRFETSLNMAASAGPLHKQSGFGQPRLGYGAEVGVPPELKSLPKNIQVAGVNGYVPSGPSANAPPTQPSSYTSPTTTLPAANNYGYAATHPPPPTGPSAQPVYQSQASLATSQPGYSSAAGGYMSSQAPVPTSQPVYSSAAGGYASPQAPPHPNPAHGGGAYSSPSKQPQGGSYPAYANHHQHHSAYPPQPQQQASSPSVYPPPHPPVSATSAGGYPSPPYQHQTSNVYPPPHPQQQQQQHHYAAGSGYPPVSSYPPAANTGYPQQQPAPSSGYPAPQHMPSAAGGFYPPALPQRQTTMPMPGAAGAGYPPAPNYPPYPPN